LQAWLEVHLHAQPGAALPEALRAGHTDREFCRGSGARL
jgi:hypothetical protein